MITYISKKDNTTLIKLVEFNDNVELRKEAYSLMNLN